MVKTIVRRHKRRTNKGRTTIKSHSRKIKGGVISPGELNIFSSMQKYPKEFGGNIDMGRNRKIEGFKVYKGGEDYVDVDPDYELLFHTHTGRKVEPPSTEDLITILQSTSQQAEIIFSGGGVTYIIIPTIRTKQLRRLPTKKLKERFDKIWIDALIKSKSYRELEKRYLNGLRKEGFMIKRNVKPNKPLHIPIEIVEDEKR